MTARLFRSSSPDTRDQLERLSVLIMASAVDMIGFAMVFPLIPLYARDLGATPETIGLILASYSIAQILIAPIWGRVSDRYGRRPVLLIGLTAAAIAYVVFAFASTIWLFFLSRVIQGAGGGTTGVAQAYVADTIRPANRARALGWLSAASAIGVAIGPVIGSLSAHWGQQAPGLVAALLCVVNLVYAWRRLPESRSRTDAAHQVPARKPAWHAAWSVLRHPRRPISRFMWIYGAGMLGFTAMSSILSLYLADRFGFRQETIGWVFMYMGVWSFVLRSVLLGPIIDRVGEAGAMRTGTIALTVGLLLFPLAGTLPMLYLVIPLVPIGTALLFPATTAMMSRVTERHELGTTMGVAQTFAASSRVLAPFIANSAYQRLGIASPFFVAGGIVALVGVLAFRLTVPTLRPEENA